MYIRCISSGSKGNAYLVSDGHSTLLIECGVRFEDIKKACNYETSSLSCVLITHEHKDHCRSVKEVIKRGLEVYCTTGTAEALGIENEYNVYHCNSDDRSSFVAGSFVISMFPTQHDAKDPCGFVITSSITKEKLLYLTDSYYCRFTFNDLTDVMIECNYDNKTLFEGSHDQMFLMKRIIRSHMSLETCIEFLKSNNLSKVDGIHLIHLSDRNSDEQRINKKVAESTGKRVVVF